MVERRRIPLEEFTHETFSSYGRCLEVPVSEPDRTAGTWASLWNLCDLEFTLKQPFAGIVRYVQRGFVCSTMERHPGETQTFVPIGDDWSILAVAAPTDGPLPDPATFKAFLLDGSKGIVLGRGTWVRHFFPLGPKADYVIITGRHNKADDVDNIDLAASLGIEFEFTLQPEPIGP